MRFFKKETYYRQPTYEFNLPAGWSCPFAKSCKIKVDRFTGKMQVIGKQYRCYASASERFPGVRFERWENFDDILAGKPIEIPKDATHIRIHASGDFFSQEYFDKWLEVIRANPKVKAFTKSIEYWVNRLAEIPANFTLQGSVGSMQDHLIWSNNLKFAMVVKSRSQAKSLGLPIDTDDWLAQQGTQSFALIDNFNKDKGNII